MNAVLSKPYKARWKTETLDLLRELLEVEHPEDRLQAARLMRSALDAIIRELRSTEKEEDL